MKYYTSKDDKTDYSSARFLCVNAIGLQKHTLFDTTVERTQGRSDYHVLYVKGGSCTAFFHGKEERLTAGDFILYPPHVPHKYIFLVKDACESYWLHFSGTAAAEILAQAALGGGIYRLPASESITALFRDMINLSLSGTKENRLEQSALLLSFLSLLSRQIKGETDPDGFVRVKYAMAKEIDRPYDAARYAAMCALSESRFSHKFKEKTGLPPLSYFLSLKLERAKEMLASSDLTVGEIACSVGFESPLYFSRFFKQQIGESPSHYKKRIQNTR